MWSVGPNVRVETVTVTHSNPFGIVERPRDRGESFFFTLFIIGVSDYFIIVEECTVQHFLNTLVCRLGSFEINSPSLIKITLLYSQPSKVYGTLKER